MADFLDTTRREIEARIKELQPLVDEYRQLETAANALGVAEGSASAPVPRNGRRKRGRPRRATTPKAKAPAARSGRPAKRRAGRPKGGGTRAAEALAFVQRQPGITIPELAAKMGIKHNYLYRVMPSLEEGGRVTKRGRGWHPKA